MENLKTERAGLILVNLLLITAFCLFATSGCYTYQKAIRKFGHVAKDSVTITVMDTVTIPKDSIVTSFRTDTTIFHKVIETLRSKLTINRTPKLTTIQAECKPDTIIRKVRANCPPVATFGVAPWYKWGFWIMVGLLIVAIIVYAFTYLFKLSMIKR